MEEEEFMIGAAQDILSNVCVPLDGPCIMEIPDYVMMYG